MGTCESIDSSFGISVKQANLGFDLNVDLFLFFDRSRCLLLFDQFDDLRSDLVGFSR
jgi:hypothetical protein